MSYQNIDQLIEQTSGRHVPERIKRLKRIMSIHEYPFVMGFCASSKEEFFPLFIEYLRKELGIPDESKTEYIDLKPLIDKGVYHLKDLFKRKIPEWNSQAGNPVFVVPTRFECMPNYERRESTLQDQGCAHLFTQLVKEDTATFFSGKPSYYEGLRKQVVVVTHIGHSLGEERYRNAVLDASRSGNRFQDFMFELNP